MKLLRLRSYAKVNLGLEVLGMRDDGYHELRTIFQTVDLHDDVVLRPRPSGISVKCAHPAVPRDETNLAARAARELQRFARRKDGVEIEITKRIPVAGGLGGGSSNAACTLLGLDLLWKLGLGPGGLHPLASRLGADVPYFLTGGTALGTARGDEIYPLHLQIRAHLVLVDPDRPLKTAAVFGRLDARLTPRENSYTIFRFVSRHLEGMSAFGILRNDLESAALEEAPDLSEKVGTIRRVLLKHGAALASLSGSGSTYFGLFDDPGRARRARLALVSEGFRATAARTVTLERYRKGATSWRSQTSR
jgi:4-diphosphocytidyl-2-C-methyl-D-erythritol kinase